MRGFKRQHWAARLGLLVLAMLILSLGAAAGTRADGPPATRPKPGNAPTTGASPNWRTGTQPGQRLGPSGQARSQPAPAVASSGVTPNNSLAPLANGTWTQLSSATSPGVQGGYSMATDWALKLIVFFGGYTGCPTDTFIWNGSGWRDLAIPGPSARFGAGMAYDPSSRRVILFGGVDCHTDALLNDTWSFSGSSWTQLSPTTSPSPRTGMAMGTDFTRGAVVLYGGNVVGEVSGNNCFSLPECAVPETWTFSGGNWHPQLCTSSSCASPGMGIPSARAGTPGLAPDTSGVAVLYAGMLRGYADGNGDDTWLWNGNSTWTSTDSSPGSFPLDARASVAMAQTTYPAGGVLLFGGRGLDFLSLCDTWFRPSGSASTWVQLMPAASPPCSGNNDRWTQMATDLTTGGTPLLYHGNDATTWRFGP